MIRRTVSTVNVISVIAVIILVIGSRAPSQAITRGYATGYGGLWDASGVPTNIYVNAYQTSAGFTGKFSWTVRGLLSVSASASYIQFDSPTHVTMRGSLVYNGLPCLFELKLTKPGIVSQWGNISLQIVDATTGLTLYPTVLTTDGGVSELPMYSSNVTWIYYP